MSSSLPFRFALFFSLSLAGATATATATSATPRKLALSSSHSPSLPKATTSDLLSLLGPPDQAASVNSVIARDLFSCFKFLAPFNHSLTSRRSLASQLRTPLPRTKEEIDDELIISPPPSVLELARLALDSGADPGAIHRALDPTIIRVTPLSPS